MTTEPRDRMEPRGGRRKLCRFCSDPRLKIDYKEAKVLKMFMTERERIAPQRISGLCAYHQRQLARAVKRGRILGIVPFSASPRG